MSDPKAIHPFKLSIPQSDLDDLQTRLRLTRWPDKEPVTDESQGVPLSTIQDLCTHWQASYNWRRCEDLLNSYPQFTTTIDGLGIYFLHIRSKHKDALPMIITHGWPGSVLEFRHVIPNLIDPEDASDAFHLVIPALPGYAFSGKPTETGWGIERTARAWVELMERLGYADAERGWVAQGGDWGAHVSACLGHLRPRGLRGVHLNSIFLDPKQSTRPQTLGYGLSDSPTFLAAWLYEKISSWSDQSSTLSTDEILDTITLYWLSNSGTSSARYYWECEFDSTGWNIGADVPVGVSWFPGDTAFGPREWCERYYEQLVHWRVVERGGHFAAWEVPELFVREVREWRGKI